MVSAERTYECHQEVATDILPQHDDQGMKASGATPKRRQCLRPLGSESARRIPWAGGIRDISNHRGSHDGSTRDESSPERANWTSDVVPKNNVTVIGGRNFRKRPPSSDCAASGDRESSLKKKPKAKVPVWKTAHGKYENGLRLVDVPMPTLQGEPVEDECAACFDERLMALYDDADTLDGEVPVHRLTHFTIYDESGFVAPLDAGLIEKDVSLYAMAVIKPVTDDTDVPDGGPFCRRIGPIHEWHVEGFDGGERSIIGIGTAFCDYKLMGCPSPAYAPFMSSIREKALLLKMTIELLQRNPETTYEELLAAVSGQTPEGLDAEPFTSDIMLRHATYLLDQVWDYDQWGDHDENGEGGSASSSSQGDEGDVKLYFTPAMQHLCKLEGYPLSRRRQVARSGGMRRSRSGAKKSIHRGMKATTTPLVDWVFEDYFQQRVSGSRRNADDSWSPFLRECDGEEVFVVGKEGRKLTGVLRFRADGSLPCVEVSCAELHKESKEQTIASRGIEDEGGDARDVSLAQFEKLAGSLSKKSRESIKIASTGYSLSRTAKSAGWVGIDGNDDLEDDACDLEGPDEDAGYGNRTTANLANVRAARNRLSTCPEAEDVLPTKKTAGRAAASPTSVSATAHVKKSKTRNSRVYKWVGRPQVRAEDGIRFYEAVMIDGTRLEAGDAVISRDENGQDVLCRITHLWQDKEEPDEDEDLVYDLASMETNLSRKKRGRTVQTTGRPGGVTLDKATTAESMMITGHRYIMGADTSLGPVAAPKEVFLLDEVVDVRVMDVVSPARVSTRHAPVDWNNKGGEAIEEYLAEMSMFFSDNASAGVTEFYVQKLYEPVYARFVDLPAVDEILPPEARLGGAYDYSAMVSSMVEIGYQSETGLSRIVMCLDDLAQDKALPVPEAHSLVRDAKRRLEDRRRAMTLGKAEVRTKNIGNASNGHPGKTVTSHLFQGAQLEGGERFRVGDCVYLDPDAYGLAISAPDESGGANAGWREELRKRRRDPVKYPELWRRKDGGHAKGAHDGTPPFLIARVEAVFRRERENIKLSVRKFYRPEETHHGMAFAHPRDEHLLFWSYEVQVVDLDDVIGRCTVERLGPDEDDWPFAAEGGRLDRFFFRQAYNTKDEDNPKIVPAPLRAQEQFPSKVVTDSSRGSGRDGRDPNRSGHKGKGKGRSRNNGKGKSELMEVEDAGAAQEHHTANAMAVKLQRGERKPLAMLDIFAGCGGLSQGLHDAGVCQSRWAIEFEKPAAEAFSRNFTDTAVFTDDCNVLLKSIMDGANTDGRGTRLPRKGEVEVLCGGPPCQGFSGMNRFSQGQYSTFKNSLVTAYLSYCDYFRPRLFLLENVKNFAHYKDSAVLRMCIRALICMGYQVTFGTLQAAQFGVPQSRRRMFLVAAAPGTTLPRLPLPTHTFTCAGTRLTVNLGDGAYCPTPGNRQNGPAPLRRVTVRDAIGDLPRVELGAAQEELPYDTNSASTDYQRAMRRGLEAMAAGERRLLTNGINSGEASVGPLQAGKGKAGIVYDHIVKDMGPMHLARFENIPSWPGADWRVLPNVQVTLRDGRKTKLLEYTSTDKGGQEYVSHSGHGGVGHEPQDNTLIPWCLPHTGNRHNHWAGLYGRLDWEGHFGTTVTNPEPMGKQGVVVHPEQNRVVSVRECARSQGFPDHFRFCGGIMERYRQIGNAVPPPLAKAIGLEWDKALKADEERNRQTERCSRRLL